LRSRVGDRKSIEGAFAPIRHRDDANVVVWAHTSPAAGNRFGDGARVGAALKRVGRDEYAQ
jgi:hypothetical protein